MALMKKHQIGITEFAEKCGMEEGRLERILHSRGRLTPAEAVKIAAAFGQTMEEAFDIEPLPMDEVHEMENTEFHKMVTEHLNTIAKIHKTTPSEFAEQCGLKERRVKNLLDGTARMSVVEAVRLRMDSMCPLIICLGIIRIRCRHRRRNNRSVSTKQSEK